MFGNARYREIEEAYPKALLTAIYEIRRFTPGALLWWVQIALKPASKTLGPHRVFIRGKGLKYAIADSTFKRMQVDARAC